MTDPREPSSEPLTYAGVGRHAPGGELPQGFAITSLVCGIASIPLCFCYGIPSIPLGVVAIIFGRVSLQNPDRGGDGLAKGGLICGIVGLCLGLAYLLLMGALIGFAIYTTPPPPPPPPAPPAPTLIEVSPDAAEVEDDAAFDDLADDGDAGGE